MLLCCDWFSLLLTPRILLFPSSQELNYRLLGVSMRAVFQQPELRGISARARPLVTLCMALVLFSELLFFYSLYLGTRSCAEAGIQGVI